MAANIRLLCAKFKLETPVYAVTFLQLNQFHCTAEVDVFRVF